MTRTRHVLAIAAAIFSCSSIACGELPQFIVPGHEEDMRALNELFLGFQATAEGYEVDPRLPKDWPSLTISGIRFHDRVLTITAHEGGRVEVK